jgi:hypothetical protein
MVLFKSNPIHIGHLIITIIWQNILDWSNLMVVTPHNPGTNRRILLLDDYQRLQMYEFSNSDDYSLNPDITKYLPALIIQNTLAHLINFHSTNFVWIMVKTIWIQGSFTNGKTTNIFEQPRYYVIQINQKLQIPKQLNSKSTKIHKNWC